MTKEHSNLNNHASTDMDSSSITLTAEQKALENAKFFRKQAFMNASQWQIIIPTKEELIIEHEATITVLEENTKYGLNNPAYVQIWITEQESILGYLKPSYPDIYNDNEVIMSLIGDIFGIPTATTHPVKAFIDQENFIGGVLSVDAKKVNERAALIIDYMNEEDIVSDNNIISDPYEVTTVIQKCLRVFLNIPEITENNFLECRKQYLNTLLFDYLINITERNAFSVGILYDEKIKKYRMAPLFSNGNIRDTKEDNTIRLITGDLVDRDTLINVLMDEYYSSISLFASSLKLYKNGYLAALDTIITQNTYEEHAKFLKTIINESVERVVMHPKNQVRDEEADELMQSYLRIGDMQHTLNQRYEGRVPITLTSEIITSGPRKVLRSEAAGRAMNLLLVLLCGIGIGTVITLIFLVFRHWL